MVISDDIKFPRPFLPAPYRFGKKVDTVDGIAPVARIGAFKREWSRSREEDRSRQKGERPFPDELSVRRLVEKANSYFANQNISLHLVLTGAENCYAIDVYDCTGTDRCSIIGDVIIDPADLPLLLIKLEQETGLLLDTVS
jgi:hypothetical protein